MGYRPLPDCLELRESPIEGMGLFAKTDIPKGTNLGITHINFMNLGQMVNLGLNEGVVRTPLGAYYNHSVMPNAKKVPLGIDWDTDIETFHLETICDVKAGEEITVHYTFYDPTKGE